MKTETNYANPTISQKSLDFIRYAAEGHMGLVNNGRSCLWGDTDSENEQKRAMSILDSLRNLPHQTGKNNGKQTPVLSKEAFWFLDFLLNEWSDFVQEGETFSPSYFKDPRRDSRMAQDILAQLRVLAGIDAKEYAMGPDEAYCECGVEVGALCVAPQRNANPGRLTIMGRERTVSFVDAPRKCDAPYVFLHMERPDSAMARGKKTCSLQMRLAQLVDDAYNAQNVDDQAGWTQEYIMFLSHLLNDGEIMVNPTKVDFDKLSASDKKLLNAILVFFGVAASFNALRESFEEDPELPGWLREMLS